MSDDYAIQNVAAKISIPIYSFRQRGIKKEIEWEIYCSSCFRIFKQEQLGKKCVDCDVHLKRRPKKNTKKLRKNNQK